MDGMIYDTVFKLGPQAFNLYRSHACGGVYLPVLENFIPNYTPMTGLNSTKILENLAYINNGGIN